jgi:microcystin-dependent protein
MGNRAAGQFVDATDYNSDTFDIGDVKPACYRSAPNQWLGPCIGQAVSRTTYADLFAKIVPDLGAVTVTIASPGVFTLASHGLVVGDRVYFTTTGALPTGLSANTIYYVVSVPTSSTFTVSASEGGSAVNTSGSQSGTHHVWHCPYGLGDGSTTFNLPDFGGRAPVGASGSGGHTDVKAGGQNEGVALANRRPKHRTSNNLTATASYQSYSPGTQTSGNVSIDQDANAGFPGSLITVTLGGSIGTNNANDALDTSPYLAVYWYIKYA